MLDITQCAPYRDGLAGVHGVLEQFAVAMYVAGGLARACGAA
jgi:hypothetical protein